jgi:hypothetical protein
LIGYWDSIIEVSSISLLALLLQSLGLTVVRDADISLRWSPDYGNHWVNDWICLDGDVGRRAGVRRMIVWSY